MDNVHTFEYPSFSIVMAEFSTSASDNEDEDDEDEEKGIKIIPMDENIVDQMDDMNDDELEQLARANAEFNTTNSADKALQPKGTSLYLFFLSTDISSGTSV